MKSPNIKIITLILAICMILPAFRAGALFDADHNSKQNTITMNELDLVVEESESFSAPLKQGTDSIMRFSATTTRPVDFWYKVGVENPTGELCAHINISAVINSTTPVYSGPLSSLLIAVNPPFTLPQDWVLSASLDSDDPELEKKSCDFDLILKAYQTGYNELDSGGFYDKETLKARVSSGNWTVSCSDIVINEIMWMGSEKSNDDEWIELRNTTDHDIDIGKWKLENTTYSKSSIKIPENVSIPAGGYYLISRYPAGNPHSHLAVEPDQIAGNLYLRNSGHGIITLRNAKGEIADQAQGSPWPAGKYSNVWQSMERNAVAGDGLSPASWHTCTLSSANDLTYWDLESLTFGTPKMRNTAFNGCEYGNEPECEKDFP